MPETFAITTTTTTVPLDGARRGRADFTVSNTSGRALQAHARIVPANPAAAPWLSLQGAAERDFPVSGTQQYSVTVAAPPTAPPGSYPFRLDVIGVDDPDDEFSNGPSVTFTVAAPLPVRAAAFPWWIVAVAAALVLLVGGIAAFLLNRACVPPTPGAWKQAAALPAAGQGMGTASDGTLAYVVGGAGPRGLSSRFDRYDPAADTWTGLPAMPTPAEGAFLIYLDQRFYAFGGGGGGNGFNTTRIFNPADVAWTTGLALPETRAYMAGGLWNGRVYLAGGSANAVARTAQSQTWDFDPANVGSWGFLAAMPAARSLTGYGLINGHLYVVGGADANGTIVSTTFDYDIAQNSWRSLLPVPQGVRGPASAVVDGQLWLVGGFTGGGYANVTQIFDPATQTWSSGPKLASGREAISGVRSGDYVLALGGGNGSVNLTTNEVSLTQRCPNGQP